MIEKSLDWLRGVVEQATAKWVSSNAEPVRL